MVKQEGCGGWAQGPHRAGEQPALPSTPGRCWRQRGALPACLPRLLTQHTGTLMKQCCLTPAPCPEHQHRLRAEQREAEPWGGWWAAPVHWSVAGFVTKGQKHTCRQRSKSQGSSSHRESYRSHRFQGNLLLPWFRAALPAHTPQLWGTPCPESATEPKEPPRGWGELSRVHTRACTQMKVFVHALAAHTCLHPPRAPRHTPMCSHTRACPRMPPGPGPSFRLLPVLCVTSTSGLPARLAGPCQLPWQCSACQEMKFALHSAARGQEQPGVRLTPRLCPAALPCC